MDGSIDGIVLEKPSKVEAALLSVGLPSSMRQQQVGGRYFLLLLRRTDDCRISGKRIWRSTRDGRFSPVVYSRNLAVTPACLNRREERRRTTCSTVGISS